MNYTERIAAIDAKDLIYGIKSPLWYKNYDRIKELMVSEKYKDMFVEVSPTVSFDEREVSITAGRGVVGGFRVADLKLSNLAQKPQFIPDEGIAGGIRIAHFHIDGKVYACDKAVWNDFATNLKKDMMTALKEANTIGFNQMLELSEALYTR